jgi:hypothetical protein
MNHLQRHLGLAGLLLATGLSGLAACSTADESPGSAGGGGAGGSASSSSTGTGTPTVPSVGACSSTNPFSKGAECKEYTGTGWTPATAAADCQSSILGAPGTFAAGATCGFPEELGTCTVTRDDGSDYLFIDAGTDAGSCSMAKTACEVFAQGSFTPGSTCDGSVPPGTGGGNVFTQPYQVCKDPLPGEPPGQSAGGQVCTWTLISGCTEAGRHYQDYASCADVLTQRPYYPGPAAGATPAGDPRLADTAYLAEVAWARSQVEASACVCCHSSALAPQGASQWYLEAPGIWLDSVADSGIALMAGLVSSEVFGAFPPAENNGFNRTEVGLPTTDVPRMQALLLGEWARRGHTVADAAAIPPFGGPLADQLTFAPGACTAGQGVAADGSISWSGGSARYLYILAAGAKNPSVPPNLDQPAGTLWLVDVPTKSKPFASGLTFGALTGDLKQRIPTAGAPAPLVAGSTYYLYVLADVGIPITRCLFTAP